MKSVFILMIFITSLFSKNLCYTIQIASFSKTPLNDIKKEKFPKKCQIVKTKKGYAIRCECEKKKDDILRKLSFYKKYSPDAFITKDESFEKNENRTKEASLEELIYEVFIYNGDLKNAYKVVKKVLKKKPFDTLWRKRLADILLWSGKSKEALKEYMKIYKKEKNKKLEDTILKLSISTKNYKEAFKIYKKRVLKNPTDKNIDTLTSLCEKLGELRRCADILDRVYKKTRDPDILRKDARIYFELEDLKAAKKRYLLLYRYSLLKPKDAFSLAWILFLEKKDKEALSVLKSTAKRVSLEDVKFWRKLSRFYEFLGDEKSSMEILKRVCLQNGCEKEDYSKLIRYYLKKDKKFALKMALKAFRQKGDLAFLLVFAKEKIKEKRAKDVLKILNSLSKEREDEFKENPSFWLLKGEIYNALGKRDAFRFYEEALKRDPSSIEILSKYAFYLISANNIRKLKNILLIIEAKGKIDSRSAVLAAMINYRLGNYKKAIFYYKKALKNNLSNQNLKIDYAYLLIASGKRREGLSLLRDIFQEDRKRLKKNPSLYKNREFLKRYLREALFFLNSPSYLSLLKRAKKVLSKSEYINLKSSFLAYKNKEERVKFLIRDLQDVQTWLKLYLSLKDEDSMKLRELLYRYFSILPPKGKIEALIKSFQIGEAKSEAFRALENSSNNFEVYKLKYDLDERYSNRFITSFGYEKREGLNRKYIEISNILHLIGRYYIGFLANAARGEYYSVFDEYRAKMWIKILQERGYLDIGAGYRDVNEGYKNLFLQLYRKISKKASFKFKASKGEIAKETRDLFVNGNKDSLSFDLNYLLSPKISLLLSAKRDRYFSNNIFLGKGEIASISFRENLSSVYPDISFREYFTVARFKGDNLKDLKNYTQGGGEILIGDNFLGKISSPWRAFLKLGVFENSLYGFGYLAKIASSGRFLGDDNLMLSLAYNRSSFASNDELWLFELKHTYLY